MIMFKKKFTSKKSEKKYFFQKNFFFQTRHMYPFSRPAFHEDSEYVIFEKIFSFFLKLWPKNQFFETQNPDF